MGVGVFRADGAGDVLTLFTSAQAPPGTRYITGIRINAGPFQPAPERIAEIGDNRFRGDSGKLYKIDAEQGGFVAL